MRPRRPHTAAVLACSLALAWIGGCDVVPRSGVFSCARDGRCPASLACVGGLCVTPGETLDAWTSDDASIDASAPIDSLVPLDTVVPIDLGPRPDTRAPDLDAGPEPLGCLALGVTAVSSEIIPVSGSKEVYGLEGVVLADAEELWMPMAWNGVLELSPVMSSMANDGAVLRVTTPALTVSSLVVAGGSGSQTLRQLTFVGGVPVYAGTANTVIEIEGDTIGVAGPAAFLHAGTETQVFGGFADTVDVSTYDLIAVSDSRFCAAGVAIGRFTSTLMPVEAGFVVCSDLAFTDVRSALMDGDGRDSVTALALGPDGSLFIAGTLTNNAVPPGTDTAIATLPTAEGRGYIVRTNAMLTDGEVFVFGAETAGASGRTAVHDLLATDAGVYFVGRLAEGASEGFPRVINGMDAVAGHVSIAGGMHLDWAHTHDVGAFDQYLRASQDSCRNLIAVGELGAADSNPEDTTSRPLLSVFARDGREPVFELGAAGGALRGVAVLSGDELYLAGRTTTVSGSVLGQSFGERGYPELFVVHAN